MAKLEFFDTPGYGEIAVRNHYSKLYASAIASRSRQGGWDADFTLSATSWRRRSSRRATTSKRLSLRRASAGATS